MAIGSIIFCSEMYRGVKALELKLHSNISDDVIKPSEPLWKRVPTKDSDGKPLSDFMMLIPRLSSKPPHIIGFIVKEIRKVLEYYQQYIVFVDLNIQLNLLWVSIKSVPGICLEVAAALHALVPEAKLVAQKI